MYILERCMGHFKKIEEYGVFRRVNNVLTSRFQVFMDRYISGSLGWELASRSSSTFVESAILRKITVVSGEVRSRPVGGRCKRILDFLLSLFALIILSPLMLLIAVLIKVTMGGPVIFYQERVGYANRLFKCYKFRTMVTNAEQILDEVLANDQELALEWKETQKLAKDPRVTLLGRVLRKTSLDELPQLFNVLIGDMSCVGPRPILRTEVRRYGVHSLDYLRARPGVTGIWQVSGRNSLGYDTRVALDTLYVGSWSLLVDIVILVKTLPALMRSGETS